MLLELLAGTLAGGIHAVSGPDHLAAVAPFAVRRPRAAARIGLRWGLGHAAGVMLLALCGAWLRDALPIDLWSQWAERGVGVVLVAIGLWALRGALRSRLHAHEHTHAGESHTHVHLHGAGEAHPVQTATPHAHTHAAFAVGTLHGVAGTAHLVGVLPALALPSWEAATLYVTGYGVGATGAMAAFGWLVGRVSGLRGFDGTRVYRGILSASGVLAILVGGVWLST